MTPWVHTNTSSNVNLPLDSHSRPLLQIMVSSPYTTNLPGQRPEEETTSIAISASWGLLRARHNTSSDAESLTRPVLAAARFHLTKQQGKIDHGSLTKRSSWAPRNLTAPRCAHSHGPGYRGGTRKEQVVKMWAFGSPRSIDVVGYGVSPEMPINH